MEVSADLSLVCIFAAVAASVYLFKLHQGFLILSLSSGIYFVQSLALKSSQVLVISSVNYSLQQQIISAIFILLPIVIAAVKFRGKSKLSLVKSIIGSLIVAGFFVVTAGTYLATLRSFIGGPLFIKISHYSFQIGLVAFLWMAFIYLIKQRPDVAPKK